MGYHLEARYLRVVGKPEAINLGGQNSWKQDNFIWSWWPIQQQGWYIKRDPA